MTLCEKIRNLKIPEILAVGVACLAAGCGDSEKKTNEKIFYTKSNIKNIRFGFDLYYLSKGCFPKGDNADMVEALKKEDALKFNEDSSKNSQLLDGWGKPFVYRCSDGENYVFYSCGPNRKDDNGKGDDISKGPKIFKDF